MHTVSISSSTTRLTYTRAGTFVEQHSTVQWCTAQFQSSAVQWAPNEYKSGPDTRLHPSPD
jgi:hypothetical protein